MVNTDKLFLLGLIGLLVLTGCAPKPTFSKVDGCRNQWLEIANDD